MRVIRVPPERLDAFEQALLDQAGQPVDQPGEHERFRIRLGRWELTAYGSGKVVVHDDALMPVLVDVLEEVLEPFDETVVGSDEAGKGEWLGPLAIAACAVAPEQRAELVAAGVMDSKELSRERVLDVAETIEAEVDHQALVLVAPPRFNELYAELKREGKTLNDLVAWAHARALGEVLESLETAGEQAGVRVVVDEFDRVATQARTARVFDVERFPLTQRQQAEDEIAVAAASVLAKAARERWVDRYEQQASIDVRGLSIEEAREHPDKDAFAKTSFVEP